MRYRGIGIVALVIFVLVAVPIFNVPNASAILAQRWQWCKGVTGTGTCITPVDPAVFQVTDPAAYILITVTELNGIYDFQVNWRDPTGDLCNECTDNFRLDFDALNSAPMWDGLQIAGRLPASRPGVWTVEVLVDPLTGTGFFTLLTASFTIGMNQPPPTPTFSVTVSVSPQVTTSINVDGQSSPAGTRFDWKQGEQHSLSVKKIVPGDKDGVQYVFTGWSDGVSDPSRQVTVNNNLVLTAEYKTQYQLTVVSDHGSATGEDWYDDGAKAYAVLDTGSISDGLFYNWAFAGWTDDAQGTNLKSNPITMNSPKTATANWNHEFSTTFYAVIAAVIAIAAVAGFMLMRRSKAPKIPGQTQMTTPDTKLSGEKKYCANCRAVLPVEAKVCSTCGQAT